MKIAIPVWQNNISPLFDTTAHLLVAETEHNKIINQEVLSMESLNLFQRVDLLARLRIHTFICGGITRPILESIRNKNVQVIPFVCGEANVLLQAMLTGEDLQESFAMPGKSEKEKNK